LKACHQSPSLRVFPFEEVTYGQSRHERFRVIAMQISSHWHGHYSWLVRVLETGFDEDVEPIGLYASLTSWRCKLVNLPTH